MPRVTSVIFRVTKEPLSVSYHVLDCILNEDSKSLSELSFDNNICTYLKGCEFSAGNEDDRIKGDDEEVLLPGIVRARFVVTDHTKTDDSSPMGVVRARFKVVGY